MRFEEITLAAGDLAWVVDVDGIRCGVARVEEVYANGDCRVTLETDLHNHYLSELTGPGTAVPPFFGKGARLRLGPQHLWKIDTRVL